MAIARLAVRSLWNRRTTALLTVLAIGISVALLLGVQKLRTSARDGFASTISGVDLVVGARSAPVNLLLYSVFRIGDATANVSWTTYQKIAHHRDVAWTIPLSLGDSHRGFRVLGTTGEYFEHYRFADQRSLRFTAGEQFADRYDAVIGSDVAEQLRYRVGDSITLAHGLAAVSFAEHTDKPFRIRGVLARTGTPVDRTVHVSLDAMSALHGAVGDMTPPGITAFLVGMHSKAMILTMQRALNEYRQEPMTAVLPVVALSQLWQMVGIADTALTIVAAFVVAAGLVGMLTAILTTLNERRREMAILRSVGARPAHIFTLLLAEAGVLALGGALLGVALTYLAMLVGRPWLEARLGVFLTIDMLSARDFAILASVVGSAIAIGLVPAFRAYRNTLSDGLQIRV